MPEGDTILKTARSLHKALAGKAVLRAKSTVPAVDAARFHSRSVHHVDAHGKDLLIHFDDGSTLHSHMMMTGSWHIYRVGQRWGHSAADVKVLLETADCVAVCFSAPVVEWLPPGGVERHPRLTRLGPDILADDFSVEPTLERLRSWSAMPLGEAILQQQAVAGIGNVYKSEVLFICRLNPFVPVSAFSDEKLTLMLTTCRKLMLRNSGPGERKTRFGVGGPPVWVYRRSGERCMVCDGEVLMQRQGEALRSTYYCPSCQSVDARAHAR